MQEHDGEVMRLKHTGWEALEEQKKANQHQFATVGCLLIQMSSIS